jgi:hypothetical protein
MNSSGALLFDVDVKKKLFPVISFSIAMGFLEAAVVIYLRELYYPSGFTFPMVPIPRLAATTELLREAATIIMLVAFGIIAGTDKIRRFGFFLISFAIWDLTYYGVLKLMLNWPISLLDWDVLFLIPVPWFAPVLAPCLVSLLMIAFASVLLRAPLLPMSKIIRPLNWTLLIIGCVTLIVSFTLDYMKFCSSLLNDPRFAEDKNLFFKELALYVPVEFYWSIFICAIVIISSQVVMIFNRIKNFNLNDK